MRDGAAIMPQPFLYRGGIFMTDTILVTYATRAGSTAGVAEAIARTLKEGGAAVEVLPVAEVTDLAPYRAIVVGSAIQGGAWLPEALDFLRAQRAALAGKPVATFTVCMTMAMKNEQARQHVADWTAPVRALVSPVREGYFAGVLDLNKVPSLANRLKFRISILLGVWSAGDNRDWAAIRAWAEDLRPVLAA